MMFSKKCFSNNTENLKENSHGEELLQEGF